MVRIDFHTQRGADAHIYKRRAAEEVETKRKDEVHADVNLRLKAEWEHKTDKLITTNTVRS